jgi:D-serine deaminase-like pyridoxal phosphate-dependent protein
VIIPREQVDWRTKGIFLPGAAMSLEEFAAARHPLFDGPFSWPVMVARRSAIEHNVGALAEFCRRHGLEFAPHGKTTMAPVLFEAQLRAGAWGITAATAAQVLAYRALGVPRVLLANELLDQTALRWIAGEVARGFEFLCYVDSVAGVEAIAAAARAPAEPADPAETGGRAEPAGQPSGALRVLVELGHAGGRTGCRGVAELTEVAKAVVATPGVELAGVAGYEGGLPDQDAAADFLDAIREATLALAAAGLLGDSVIVTAGGSQYFDLVAERLGGTWLPGLRTILRSGAYISHDHGVYARRTPYNRVAGALDPALEVWAQVTSVPEPGLAVVGMGKREAPYDEGLPVPLRVRRTDGTTSGPGGLQVTRLNDHHAYVEGPPPVPLVPGDLVCFGISHPCTAFDKWQVIPVVDDDHTVIDLIRTYF